jgi:hypothetical protein
MRCPVSNSFKLDIQLAPVLFFHGNDCFERGGDTKQRTFVAEAVEHEAENRAVR